MTKSERRISQCLTKTIVRLIIALIHNIHIFEYPKSFIPLKAKSQNSTILGNLARLTTRVSISSNVAWSYAPLYAPQGSRNDH